MGGSSGSRPFLFNRVYVDRALSAEMDAIAACPVLQNGRVKQFTATDTFPCIKRTYEVIELLR